MSSKKGRGRPNDSPDVKLSKSLSYVLRHGAEKEKISISSEGFVAVDELLKHNRFKGVTFEDIQRVVEDNSKKRFVLENKGTAEAPDWLIRASQGHSLKNIDLKMRELATIDDFPATVIHGTNRTAWETIKTQGLSVMKRHHIHLAAGKIGENGVISGMRQSAQVYIYIDVRKALDSGIKFMISDNGVILTSGNENGFIPPELFLKVESKNGEPMN